MKKSFKRIISTALILASLTTSLAGLKSPTQSYAADEIVVKDIVAQSQNSFFILEDNTVMGFGSNNYGQLGLGKKSSYETKPVLIPNLNNVVQVSSNTSNTFFLLKDGTVWGAGKSDSTSPIGTGSTSTYLEPVQITALSNVKKIVQGGSSVFAILNDGSVMAWGYNPDGQLGLGTTTRVLVPTLIPDLNNVKDILTGGSAIFAILNDGSILAWGYNGYGQLGTGNTVNQLTPTLLDFPELPKLKQLLPTTNAVIALLKDGTIMTWGSNQSGLLGDGTSSSTKRTTPTVISTISNVVSIEGSVNSAYAYLEDGSIMAWGNNMYKNLGIYSSVSTIYKPNEVTVLPEGYIKFFIGPLSNFIVPEDGIIRSFGLNLSGQLGIGNTSNTATPVTVKGYIFILDSVEESTPEITISEYNTLPTNQDITVTATTDKGTLNQNSYTFTENGSFTFIATDVNGNTASKTVTITNIDKVPPVITIGKYDTSPTNKDITVTATTNEGTLNKDSHTFTTNGSFEFIATDLAGNVSKETVTITNINKTAPVITIGSYITTPTNKDITVTATTDKGTLNETSHIFTTNGSFEFIATDALGNVAKKTVTITNIDKVAPVITIGSYETSPTNKDITVTATTNEGTLNKNSHTFTENGSFEFIATDLAGNVTKEIVTITNINKIAPIITFGEYIKTPTNQDITVTATTDKGTLNKDSHTFTSNGSFEFIASDNLGNFSRKIVSITNIDKVAPVITIGDYNTAPTNKDITVTATTNEGTLNKESYTFKENGSFEFIATDLAGNVTKKMVTITNIDKTVPVITIGSYVTTPTNKDITVTATTDKGTLNKTSHTFTENGSFEFVATDSLGNITKKIVTISNIDKVAPIITIGNYDTAPTNKDITVTAITNEGSLNKTSYTFIENGSFEFIATDLAGNVTKKTVTITNINKTAPVITIGSYITTPTNQDIAVTATTDKGTLNKTSYSFTENGSFEFVATDSLGNVAKKTVTITNIDKVAPVITIGIYDTSPTNKDITVTATTNEGSLNKTSYTFTENGSFEFIATDLAGNITKEKVTITNINKTAPVISISNYITTPTNKDITVTATTDKGTLNKTSYIFTTNGSFEFIATDSLGNIAKKTVTITNIDKVAPVITIGDYITTTTNKDITVTATTNEGTLNKTSYTFTENGSFEFIATDLAGNITKKTVTITNIDKSVPVITIGNYITTPTNKDITVTATTDKGTLNNTSHTFTENGSFEFVATDSLGNIAKKIVTISNIDKIAPIITIGNYDTAPTNKDITVAATTNEGTLNKNSHTFIENGSFEFIATDIAGNVTKKMVTITNINKTAPIITFGDYIKTPTNKDITVTATTDKGTLNKYSHTFISNGSFEFIASDTLGNFSRKIVTITNIDKVAPIISIADYITTPTNKDITVEATTNEGTLNKTSYTFTENGSFEFIATDLAGNITKKTVTITNIDKSVPVITIGNYITTLTNKDITVTATTDKGTLNKTSHTFTENGNFEFIATDSLGNITKKIVTVSNIDKTVPTVPIITVNDNLMTIKDGIDENGIKETLYNVNNTEWLRYSGPILLASGDYNIKAKSVDNAGNESEIIEKNFTIGKTEEELKLEEAIKAVEKAEKTHTQDDLDDAIILVNALPNSPVKEDLINRINVVQDYINTLAKIKDLLDKAKDSLDRGDLDLALDLISKYPNSPAKDELINEANQIKDKIDKIEEAEKKVIEAERTKKESDIAIAQDYVSALEESKHKERLQERLDAIEAGIEYTEELLNAIREATNKVKIAEAYKREPYITNAQNAVDALPKCPEKTALQERIDLIINNDTSELEKAIKEATNKVKIAETYKREPYITNAQNAVDALPECPEKNELQERLNVLKGNYAEFNLTNSIKMVEAAEVNPTKINIMRAIDAVEKINSIEYIKEDLVNRLYIIKENYNSSIGIRDYNNAVKYVEYAETNKSKYYFSKASELVTDLIETKETIVLLDRLNALEVIIYPSEFQRAINNATIHVLKAEKYDYEYYYNNALKIVNELHSCNEKTMLLERLFKIINV